MPPQFPGGAFPNGVKMKPEPRYLRPAQKKTPGACWVYATFTSVGFTTGAGTFGR